MISAILPDNKEAIFRILSSDDEPFIQFKLSTQSNRRVWIIRPSMKSQGGATIVCKWNILNNQLGALIFTNLIFVFG